MKSQRNGMIDLMKCIYAIIIVCLHSVYISPDEIRYLMPHGHLAVEFFFMVSGFLMARVAYSNRYKGENLGSSTGKFIMRKYFGLLPYLIAAWIICAAIYIRVNLNYLGVRTLCKNLILSVWQILMLDMTGLDGTQILGASWYLSAMFLVMPVLFALIIKYKTYFCRILAPLVAVFLLGYFNKRTGMVCEVHAWTGMVYLGVLRAVCGLCLGVFSHEIAKLMQVSFTKFSRICLTVIEVVGYISSIYLMKSPFDGAYPLSFIVILCLWISITLSFSNQTYTYVLFSRSKGMQTLSRYAGEFSLALYLAHGRMQGVTVRMTPGQNFWDRLPLYLCLSFAAGAMCYILGKILDWIIHQKGIYIRNIILEQK